ncbi:MAG: helix-turn-helix domain-containing protein, partial [Verrucomicrobiota bacterium]
MTQKERERLIMLARVQKKEISLRQAAGVLGLSYRQAKRVWRRFRIEGDAGLVHRLRDKPSPRGREPEFRERVLARYEKQYPDFGPTLAAEHLAREGLKLDHETLRRWLLAQGFWSVQRSRQKHRQWRERRECVGEMVQMDGSEHDWFEGRRERAVLMVLIDDATNRTYARFFEGETTGAAFESFDRYSRRHGVPQSLYVDRDSIYRTDREPTLAEQMAGEKPRTQFG